ncbi:unnamed protein product [Durusdinium trenchii]|uniref:Uncharacterized protein n=1 Tax=Durusdinium trenchii TaxID=1381693 RepID=A0ABP0NFK4_9DINO
MKVHTHAKCAQHKKSCPVPIEKDLLLAIGAPCILFSRYGLKEKWSNTLKKRVHDSAVKLQQRVQVSIHENVVGYEEDSMLDGRLFGHPHARKRVWRICYERASKQWKCPFSLTELASIILAPNSELKLDRAEVFETDLTQSQTEHLKGFRKIASNKAVYDLSQDPKHRKRTENMDNTLPCLTTSSQLWVEPAGRMMLPAEQLASLGYPCLPPVADTAGELVDLSLLDLSDAAVRKMAGNGMQLAQAGFILLMCLLCVEDK